MSSFLADAHTLSAAMKKTHHTPTATAPSKAYAACANEKGGQLPLHALLFQEKMLSGRRAALSRQWESVIRLKFYYGREAAAEPVSKALSDNRRCPERTSAASLLHRHTRCRSDLV